MSQENKCPRQVGNKSKTFETGRESNRESIWYWLPMCLPVWRLSDAEENAVLPCVLRFLNLVELELES